MAFASEAAAHQPHPPPTQYEFYEAGTHPPPHHHLEATFGGYTTFNTDYGIEEHHLVKTFST